MVNLVDPTLLFVDMVARPPTGAPAMLLPPLG